MWTSYKCLICTIDNLFNVCVLYCNLQGYMLYCSFMFHELCMYLTKEALDDLVATLPKSCVSYQLGSIVSSYM